MLSRKKIGNSFLGEHPCSDKKEACPFIPLVAGRPKGYLGPAIHIKQ
jgi:hypothetical protein